MYHRTKFALLAALFLAYLLTGCGSGSSDPQPKTTAVKTAGDSLNDVGTFGYDFTVQTDPKSPNWTSIVASAVGINQLCPRYEGTIGETPTGPEVSSLSLNPNATSCTTYSVGGATISPNKFPGLSIVTQLENMAAAGIQENDLVLIDGGANDALAALQSQISPTQLATTFANAIKQNVLSSKVKRVIVLNIPDVTLSPYIKENPSLKPYTNLIRGWVIAFNQELSSQLASESRVMVIDLFALIDKWHSSPSTYGLTNVNDAACPDPSYWGLNIFRCTSAYLATLNTTPNWWSNYLFTDYLHPTPYVYQLFANVVVDALKVRGWFY